MGISDLLKKWPAAGARREVLLITSGIDPWSPPDPQNPYLQKAIADAQRGGVLVHSIYYAEGGHFGHSYSRVNWGQNYLSELGDGPAARHTGRTKQPGVAGSLSERSLRTPAESVSGNAPAT